MELYVSNLAYELEDNGLFEAFSQFGTVRKATVVKDRDTGRSRGFGFVDMPDADAAGRAIQEMNGVHLQGRALRVSEARPRGERDRPSFGPTHGAGPERPREDSRPPASSFRPGPSSGPRPFGPPGSARPEFHSVRGPGPAMRPSPGAPPRHSRPAGIGIPSRPSGGRGGEDRHEEEDTEDRDLVALQEDKERRARKFAAEGPKKQHGRQRRKGGGKRRFDDGPAPTHVKRGPALKKRPRHAFLEEIEEDDEGDLDELPIR